MEVVSGSFHAAFPMGDPSRVGEARRHAALLAAECDFDDVESGRLALIVTELSTNLVRHAQEGQLWLSVDRGRREVEAVAVDAGPGILDVDRSLGDGFSTGGTPGTGLGAVRRLADSFDLHTSVPQGSVVLARVRAAGGPPSRAHSCVGAVSLAAPGETVCGDGWAAALDGERTSMIVVDGLGHGPDAAEAAGVALEAFVEDPFTPPRQLLERTHQALRRTRGAAVMLLQADAAAGTVRSSGAGNVMARLVSGVSDRSILSQHGTAGLTIRSPEETLTPWPPHALLMVCTDGIETRWKPDVLMPVLGRDPALAAALLARDHSRGRDDATVAVLRRKD